MQNSAPPSTPPPVLPPTQPCLHRCPRLLSGNRDRHARSRPNTLCMRALQTMSCHGHPTHTDHLDQPGPSLMHQPLRPRPSQKGREAQNQKQRMWRTQEHREGAPAGSDPLAEAHHEQRGSGSTTLQRRGSCMLVAGWRAVPRQSPPRGGWPVEGPTRAGRWWRRGHAGGARSEQRLRFPPAPQP